MDANKTPADFIDSRQAAKLLGCGERHIIRMCKQGEMEGSAKISGFWRIPIVEINKRRSERKDLTRGHKALIQRLRIYGLLHLATVNKKAQEAGEEIMSLEAQPILDDWSKHRIVELQDQLEGCSRYTAKIWADLEVVEQSFLQL